MKTLWKIKTEELSNLVNCLQIVFNLRNGLKKYWSNYFNVFLQIMLNAITLSVVILNVVAPLQSIVFLPKQQAED
jgi:hypothetical protein